MPPLARVLFVRQSSVVPGGIRHERWRVLSDGQWLEPEEVPGAEVLEYGQDSERLPPGCQYRRECELKLEVGTVVERFITEPLHPSLNDIRRLDPLSYLRQGIRNVRRQRRQRVRGDRMVVAGNFKLRPLDEQKTKRSAPAAAPRVSPEQIEAFARELAEDQNKPTLK